MKKHLMFLPSALLACSGLSHANVDDLEKKITDHVQVIEYTIKIYKDPKQECPDWKTVLCDTIGIARKPRNPELWHNLINTLNNDNNNIHGEITISVGDGTCPKGVCTEPCLCEAKASK